MQIIGSKCEMIILPDHLKALEAVLTLPEAWSILRLCLIPLSSSSTTLAMSGSALRQLFGASGSFLMAGFVSNLKYWYRSRTHPSYCFLLSSSTCSLAA